MSETVDRFLDCVSGAASLAITSDETGWAEHQKRIGYTKSGYKRCAALAIRSAVRARPKFVRDMLAMPYENHGYEVVGMGYCSTVIRMGNSAVKLIRSTERLSEEEQTQRVEKLKSTQDILLEYLEEFALPQEFEITKHPLRPKNIVAARQPFVEGYMPLRVCNADGFANLDAKQQKEVGRFTEKAFEMVDETGWVPDMLGSDNFGFTSGGESFVIVDTIPLELRKTSAMSVEYINRAALAVQ